VRSMLDIEEMLEGYALLDQLHRSIASNEEEAERIASEIVTRYHYDYGLFTMAAFSLAKLRLQKKIYNDTIGLVTQIESNRPDSIMLDDYLSAELAFVKAQALEGVNDMADGRANYVQALHYANQSFNTPLSRRIMLHLATLECAQENPEEARRLFDELLATASPYEPGVTASALIQRAQMALVDRDRSKIKELLLLAMDMGWKSRGVCSNSQDLWDASARILELASQG